MDWDISMKQLRKSAVWTFNISFPFRLEGHSVSSPFFYWDYYNKLVLSNDWGTQVKPLEASFKVFQLLLISKHILCFLFSTLFFLRVPFLLRLPYLIFCTDKMCLCNYGPNNNKPTFTADTYFGIQIYWPVRSAKGVWLSLHLLLSLKQCWLAGIFLLICIVVLLQ